MVVVGNCRGSLAVEEEPVQVSVSEEHNLVSGCSVSFVVLDYVVETLASAVGIAEVETVVFVVVDFEVAVEASHVVDVYKA